MANAAIAHENLAADASIVVSSAEILAPSSNLLQADTSKQWVGLGETTDYIVADLLSTVSFDTLALINVLADTARVRFSSVDSSGLAGDVWDSGSLDIDADYPDLIVLRPAVVTTARYVRIDLTGTEPVAAGFLFIAARDTFGINFEYNWQRRRIDPSRKTKTEGGQTQVYEKPGTWAIDVNFAALTASERNGFVEALDRDAGAHRSILFVADPDSDNLARDSIFGLISAEVTPVVQAFIDRYSKQYQIEQRL